MTESVAVAKEADAKKGVSPTRSDNSIHRVQNEPERQLGSLRGVIDNIRRDGGMPSVESIATQLSGMHSAERAPALLALQQTHGNRYVQRVVAGIQAKLVVGQPGDIYEQEVDRVADVVMRMPEPEVQRQTEEEEKEEEEIIQTKPLAEQITPLIQRQSEVEEEPSMMKPLVQRQADGSFRASHSLERRLAASQRGGSPLPDEVRSFMEPRFGVDFSGVRVHTDSEAVQMNRELNAQAFTSSHDVYFGAGRYDPRNTAGKRLLAHELSHVVQQEGGRGVQMRGVTSMNDPAEREARSVEEAFARSEPLPPITASLSPSTVACAYGRSADMGLGMSVRYDPDAGVVQFVWDTRDVEGNLAVEDYFRQVQGYVINSGETIEVARLSWQLRTDVESVLPDLQIAPTETTSIETAHVPEEAGAAGAEATEERVTAERRALENAAADWRNRRPQLVEMLEQLTHQIEEVSIQAYSQLMELKDNEIGHQFNQFEGSYFRSFAEAAISTIAGLPPPPLGTILGFVVTFGLGALNTREANERVSECQAMLGELTPRINDTNLSLMRIVFSYYKNDYAEIHSERGRIDELLGVSSEDQEELVGLLVQQTRRRLEVAASEAESTDVESSRVTHAVRDASEVTMRYENLRDRLERLIVGLRPYPAALRSGALEGIEQIRSHYLRWVLQGSTLHLAGNLTQNEEGEWRFRQRLATSIMGLSTSRLEDTSPQFRQNLLTKSWDELHEIGVGRIRLAFNARRCVGGLVEIVGTPCTIIQNQAGERTARWGGFGEPVAGLGQAVSLSVGQYAIDEVIAISLA